MHENTKDSERLKHHCEYVENIEKMKLNYNR